MNGYPGYPQAQHQPQLQPPIQTNVANLPPWAYGHQWPQAHYPDNSLLIHPQPYPPPVYYPYQQQWVNNHVPQPLPPQPTTPYPYQYPGNVHHDTLHR
jgi:hypothetical protein